MFDSESNELADLTPGEGDLLEFDWEDIETYDVASVEEAHLTLQGAVARLQGLYLILFALDSEMETTLRHNSAIAANLLLNRFPKSGRFISGILSAEPLPQDADVDAAIIHARTNQLTHLEPILTGLSRTQNAIASARQALDNVSEEVAGEDRQRHTFQAEAARRGLFDSLAKRISDPKQVDFLRDQQGGLPTDLIPVFNAWLDQALNIAQNLRELAAAAPPEIGSVPTTHGALVSAGVAAKHQDPFQP
ncbi:MAG: hypothetical protein ACOYON_05085 [Fimbriimonas sp.]